MSSHETKVDETAKRILSNLDTLGVALHKTVRESAELKRSVNDRLETFDGELKRLSREQNEHEKVRRELATTKEKLNEKALKLKGFEEFEAALVKLFRGIKADAVREIVRSELAKLGPTRADALSVDTVRSMVNEEVSKLRTPTGTGSVDVNTVKAIVKDEVVKATNAMAAARETGMPVEQLRGEIRRQIEAAVQSSPSIVMVQPKEFLVKEILKKEVEKVRLAVEALQPQTKLMLGYLAASGRTASFRDLMERFVGTDGGGYRQQYIYPLRDLPAIVEYDSNHGSLKYVWKERMKESYPDVSDEELSAAMDQVHALLVEEMKTGEQQHTS